MPKHKHKQKPKTFILGVNPGNFFGFLWWNSFPVKIGFCQKFHIFGRNAVIYIPIDQAYRAE